MSYAIVILFSYLLGCSNMAYYLSRLKKIDIRSAGSQNLGASNAAVLMGWSSGIIVGIHDFAKSILAVLLAQYFFPTLPCIRAVAGIASVIGHIFPFYLKFKGGKGFASYLGMTLALNWKFAIVVMLIVVIVTVLTDYITVGTMSTIVIVPLYMGIASHSLPMALILLIGTTVIFFRHLENFHRILNGTEIGLKSTIRGEHRAK